MTPLANTAAGWTKGEWSVAPKSYGWDHFAAIVTDTGVVATCHIAALSRSHEQTAADARLIAAAPELLKVVMDFCNALDGADCEYHVLAASARAALAKALGK